MYVIYIVYTQLVMGHYAWPPRTSTRAQFDQAIWVHRESEQDTNHWRLRRYGIKLCALSARIFNSRIRVYLQCRHAGIAMCMTRCCWVVLFVFLSLSSLTIPLINVSFLFFFVPMCGFLSVWISVCVYSDSNKTVGYMKCHCQFLRFDHHQSEFLPQSIYGPHNLMFSHTHMMVPAYSYS